MAAQKVSHIQYKHKTQNLTVHKILPSTHEVTTKVTLQNMRSFPYNLVNKRSFKEGIF